MFHLAAFFKASAGTLTDEDTPALSDQVFTVSNNHFIPPVPCKVLVAAAGGATANRLKISTPKLRAFAQPQFPRIAAQVTGFPFGTLNDLRSMPLSINAIDELSALVTTTAGASNNFVGLWLDDGHTPHPRGEGFWVHATATFTSVAAAWTSGAMTFDQTLPAGKYSVVGMRVVAATTDFARLIFPTGGWRPGCTVEALMATQGPDIFYNGNMGEYGQFASVAQPQLEVLSTVGVSAFDIFLQLIKI